MLCRPHAMQHSNGPDPTLWPLPLLQDFKEAARLSAEAKALASQAEALAGLAAAQTAAASAAQAECDGAAAELEELQSALAEVGGLAWDPALRLMCAVAAMCCCVWCSDHVIIIIIIITRHHALSMLYGALTMLLFAVLYIINYRCTIVRYP
jgi:hypothetical protein